MYKICKLRSQSVFNVLIEPYTYHLCQDCVPSAKTLTYMINDRETMIRTDAELSVLKVAQLERVQFRVHPPSKQRNDARNDVSSQAGRVVTSSLFDVHMIRIVSVRTIQAILLLLYY